MDQVFKRAILRTLVGIGILLVVTIPAFILLFPSTMMHITYDLGMENASVRYAMRVYSKTDDIDYIAHATETAIMADNDEKIEVCGLQFVQHADFTAYCALREQQAQTAGLYKQYIYGQIALAQYRQGKATDAISTAVSALGQNAFPQNNAFVALSLQALMRNDAQTVALLQQKITELDNGLSGADKAYLDELATLFR